MIKDRFIKIATASGIIILSLIIINSFQSCKQDFINNNVSVRFPDNIETVLNQSCATPSCHNSDSKASGLDLSDWSKTMEGSINGTMVIPYNAFWSHFISVINSDTNTSIVVNILNEVHKLDSSKVHMFMDWVNNGAKSRDGNIALTNFNHKAFITNQATDYVAVVNTDNNLVARLINVGGTSQLDAPHYITTDHQHNYFFVSLINEGFLEKYDVNTYNLVARNRLGNSPAHIEISPDNNTGYISNFEIGTGATKTIRKFDANNLNVLDTITDVRLTSPHGMALTANGQFLYVSAEIGEYIYKIDANAFEIVNMQPIDPSVPPNGGGTGNFRPYQVRLSPDESKLLVTCLGPSTNQPNGVVKVFNTSDLSFIRDIQVEKNPLLLKYTPDGQYIFVCNRNSNSVSVINGSTLIPLYTISNCGIQPHGVDFTSDSRYAYIACETQAGFDGHHPTVGSKKLGVTRIIKISNPPELLSLKIEMGSFPAGITIIP
jgi:YVTN family beta-propeller protein